MTTEENKLIESIVKWAFREGWKERARMQGVNKKALDRQYFERIRIIIENRHYEKAIEIYKSLNKQVL